MLDDWQIRTIRDSIISLRRNLKEDTNGIPFDSIHDISKYGGKYGMVTYVKYIPYKLTYYPYANNTIAVSDNFSGCAFVIFLHNEKWYIAHLANESSRIRWAEQWLPFCRKNGINRFTLFFPTGDDNYLFRKANQYKEYSMQAVGVITTDFNSKNHPNFSCYSLFYRKELEEGMEYIFQTRWKVVFTEELLSRKDYNIILKNQQFDCEETPNRNYRKVNHEENNNAEAFKAIDKSCIIV